MNKEFISYEQALELRNLGFDEECLGYWNDVEQAVPYLGIRRISLSDTQGGYFKLAPLYQQAFRWFREKYDLDSSIALLPKGYGFYIHENRNYTNRGESYGVLTYEEAELECLKKLIEIIKRKS